MPTAAVQNDRRKRRLPIWLLLTVCGVAFLLLTLLIAFYRGRANIRQDAADTLALVKSTCQKYDDYHLSSTTKDLQALINKALVFGLYVPSADTTREDVLARYLSDQYLTGIAVLREDLSVAAAADADGADRSALLSLILADGQAQDILAHPQKVYADQVSADGRSYDYAIAARQDSPGVIVCYADITPLLGDKYSLSLSGMLNIDLQRGDAVTVVTDGVTVISSSDPALEGLAVKDCPITNVVTSDRLPDDRALLSLKLDGTVWYGVHDIYRDYYLYVFYPARTMVPAIVHRLAISAGLYLVFCMAVTILWQGRRRERIAQLEKEYHLTAAIANIYTTDLIIYPQSNTYESITQTAYAHSVTDGIEKADEMLEAITTHIIVPRERDAFRDFCSAATAPERLRDQRFLGDTFESMNGQWFQVLLIPQRRSQTGEVTAVMLLSRNVTAQKQKEIDYQQRLRETAEQSSMANAAKTDFLRRMSHDIRTPLNGIRGMTKIAEENITDPARVQNCLSKILSTSDFLLELVNNVLDMSKLEAGEVETEHKPFDLRDVLQGAETVVSAQAADCGIVFTSDPPAGEHWHLLSSPLNIQRVLQNIMSNAVKYNRPGGSVHISCRETACENDTATFVFTCADTGIGMSPEFQARAFDTFAQEHKTARTTYSGSGLGLAIVKKTVELLGGKISFVSREGEGTTFTVTLPLTVDTSYHVPAPEPEPGARLDGVRILMAEDNALNREIATYMLEEGGALVTAAEDGQQAVDCFAASAPSSFDIILMDIMMPVLDGLDAAHAIRALDRADARTVPILAVSANAFSDDIAASREAGMNGHLSKPLDFDRVAAAIAQYIRRS